MPKRTIRIRGFSYERDGRVLNAQRGETVELTKAEIAFGEETGAFYAEGERPGVRKDPDPIPPEDTPLVLPDDTPGIVSDADPATESVGPPVADPVAEVAVEAPAEAPAEAGPLAVVDMSDDEIDDWIASKDSTVDKTVEAAVDAEAAKRLLAAENRQPNPRSGVTKGLEAILRAHV